MKRTCRDCGDDVPKDELSEDGHCRACVERAKKRSQLAAEMEREHARRLKATEDLPPGVKVVSDEVLW